jgi:hypothetical protein
LVHPRFTNGEIAIQQVSNSAKTKDKSIAAESKSTKRIRDFKHNPHPLAPCPKALGKGNKEA